MKRNIIFLAFLVLSAGLVSGQDTTATVAPAATASANKPVRHTFENQVVLNNQTVECLPEKNLEFTIQHRFGLIESEEDLWGLYAPSNIRLGLSYGITDRLSFGLGATKFKHQYDLQWKYKIFDQTQPKGMPVSLVYFGDISYSGIDESNFIGEDGTYNSNNRYTYFHELMVARKVNSHLSLQAGGTMSYMNIVDSVMAEHAFYGLSFVGRYQFSPQSSVIVDCDIPLTTWPVTTETVSGSSTIKNTKYFPIYNFSLGYEVATSAHTFQIFVGSPNAIINQESRVYNENDFFKGDMLIGFNITRNWGF
jgi:Membrane bound beta barrel domain (DUF5777)